MRVKATISYNGAKFFGFQRQKETPKTVTQAIETALKSLGINSQIKGSGRTDSGVHATGQVIHFDLPIFWQKKSLNELKTRLNQKLQYIQVKYIKVVSNNFHAQYSAKIRVYRYLIKTTKPTVFEEDFVSYYNIKDITKFQKALSIFVGEHNFKNFKKTGSPTTTDIRYIKRVKVIKKNNYIVVYFFANGYLRSQIRMMIEGALKVEDGSLILSQLKEQLDTKDTYFRTLAEPQGLYLNAIYY